MRAAARAAAGGGGGAARAEWHRQRRGGGGVRGRHPRGAWAIRCARLPGASGLQRPRAPWRAVLRPPLPASTRVLGPRPSRWRRRGDGVGTRTKTQAPLWCDGAVSIHTLCPSVRHASLANGRQCRARGPRLVLIRGRVSGDGVVACRTKSTMRGARQQWCPVIRTFNHRVRRSSNRRDRLENSEFSVIGSINGVLKWITTNYGTVQKRRYHRGLPSDFGVRGRLTKRTPAAPANHTGAQMACHPTAAGILPHPARSPLSSSLGTYHKSHLSSSEQPERAPAWYLPDDRYP